MKALAQIVRSSVACTIAVMCGAVFVASVHRAEAGINVWTSHGPPVGYGVIFALAIDPSTPNTLYAGVYGGGVFKSGDAGATWAATGPTDDDDVAALAIDPVTPSTLYAATRGGVFKSTDAGATWGLANTGLTSCSFSALAIDPTTPSTLYVAAQYYDETACGGVFKSINAGVSWAPADVGLPRPTSVISLAIDPVTPSTLYAGTGDRYSAYNVGHGVFKSTDAGVTWGTANAGLPPSTSVFGLAIDPTTRSTLYAGTDRGVFKSTDGASRWQAVNTGLPGNTVFALVIDPITPSTLYAGVHGGGVFKSGDAGATWAAANAGLANTVVTALVIDPSTPNTLHAGTSGGVFSIQQVAACSGDCNIDGTVTVDELITGVNIALSARPVGVCPSFDTDDDGLVTVEELIAGVNSALNGCPAQVLSGTLLVTDSLANKVYALDAATGGILASADTQEHPNGVEKTNGKVYVANENSDTISVFDSATLLPRTLIPVCHGPHHTAVSPDGSRVYAACVGTNKVAVVDATTDVLVGLLTSGAPEARTHQPWPTKDGKRLWVANWESNDITEIDLQTDTILRMFPLAARPIEVVVPADAKTAYASVPALSKMMVFDLQTNQLVAEPAMLAPENLMLSGDGKTILTSWSGTHNPTAVSIFDTASLTAVEVTLPRGSATHTDMTPHAKFGFVSLLGRPQGIVVVDIEAAAIHAFYPIADAGLVHAVRYAPGPP